ncbi:hypothetical protein [uncultured Acinetobacter sp.]|uniref:hypothetical protein n=1 Tax=uncultured Acinetobacter sp. TaxID=165433 RepID=UPI0025855991|nr:hypothetical protein [uncultured Acinetobacter sp.]
MSRLQVGGLALIIKGSNSDKNVGKVVELTSYLGDHKSIVDAWFCYCKDGLIMDDNSLKNEGAVESHRLIPLGDDQTQAEFRKELDELVF